MIGEKLICTRGCSVVPTSHDLKMKTKKMEFHQELFAVPAVDIYGFS